MQKLRKRTHHCGALYELLLVLDLLLYALFFFKSFLACSGLSPFAVDLVGPGAWQAPFKDPKSSHDQKRHWKQHSLICQLVQNMGDPIPSFV